MDETVLNSKRVANAVAGVAGCLLGVWGSVLVADSAPKDTEAQPTLKVCYDQWPPMTIFPTEDEARRGFVIDMLSDIYRDAGIALEFFEVPYVRGMQMVAEGVCDMLPEKEFSPLQDAGYEYAQQATFAYPTAFVVRQGDSWQYAGIQSVQGRRVATGQGWSYSSMSEAYQAFLDAPENQPLVEVMSGDADVVDRIMLMIAEGRVDMYADNLFVLHYVLDQNGLADKLKVITPGLDNKLVEKPIFSSRLDATWRQRLISIWDEGRKGVTPQQEAAYMEQYGIRLPDLKQ